MFFEWQRDSSRTRIDGKEGKGGTRRGAQKTNEKKMQKEKRLKSERRRRRRIGSGRGKKCPSWLAADSAAKCLKKKQETA
jgi:hypothetical protein